MLTLYSVAGATVEGGEGIMTVDRRSRRLVRRCRWRTQELERGESDLS